MTIILQTVAIVFGINVLFVAVMALPVLSRWLRQRRCRHHFYASDCLQGFNQEGNVYRVDFCSRCGKNG